MTGMPPHLFLLWVLDTIAIVAYLAWHVRRYESSSEPVGASQQEVERAVQRIEDGDQA